MAGKLLAARRGWLGGKGSETAGKEELTKVEGEYFLAGYRQKGCQDDAGKIRSQGFRVQVSDPEGCLSSPKPVGRFQKQGTEPTD